MSEIFGAKTVETTASAPAAPKSESKLSPLQLLALEAKKDLARTVTYDVSEREGWSAKYDTTISLEDYKRFSRVAQGKKKRPEDADLALLSGMALVEYNVGVYFNGALVEDTDGDALVFKSDAFIDMFGGTSGVDALSKFMGDGHMVSIASALYREAGFGDEATPADPTEA